LQEAEASLAVRMALGESNVIADNKAFLKDNGVRLSAFDTRVTARSRTVRHCPPGGEGGCRILTLGLFATTAR
jgi:hypothetical protein